MLELVALSAQDMPVPIPVQVRYFKKVFAYDKTVPRENIKLLVVYGDATPTDVREELVEAFNSIGIRATAVKSSQLASAGADVNVVYAAPGSDIRIIKEFCRTNGVLSISGLPNLATNGDVSIAINAVNDMPKVIVNPDRLKIEKQDAADLMRLR
ncbi:MAG: hypothetical protein RML40_08930 [Bacteroidota bacterium]|nr:hypothetical protein [Candidatus Kapabacteria bacterium]MDW8220641.1 hypothetical protein [Bacteroidota bacterium]